MCFGVRRYFRRVRYVLVFQCVLGKSDVYIFYAPQEICFMNKKTLKCETIFQEFGSIDDCNEFGQGYSSTDDYVETMDGQLEDVDLATKFQQFILLDEKQRKGKYGKVLIAKY